MSRYQISGFINVCILVFFVTLSSCKHKNQAATKYYEHYQNKVYQDFDTAAYNAEFKKQLAQLRPQLRYAAYIDSFYKREDFEPHFADKFVFNGGLKTLVSYLKKATEHGLNPAVFQPDSISIELEKLEANKFSTVEQVYPVFARLEILTANSLINYSSVLQFGAVNPRKLYFRYDIPVQRPDSISIKKVFSVEDLPGFLEQVQPKDTTYLKLKKALAAINTNYVDSSKLAQIKTIKLNMERLRWKKPAKENSYILVNIPAFGLQYFENGVPTVGMKVCVGEPRYPDYEQKLKAYIKTHSVDDRPVNHETTILCSHITTIQLNPTWNIPTSIAQNEIYYAIQKDPAYLANNNIRVYYKDKLVSNPDSINWAKVSRQKMPYKFKQDASDLNALGKFKFIFDNESSIYLHDTPNKAAFFKKWRAVSHGCVRVEDPLKLAQVLVNDTSKIDNIRMQVGLEPINEINKPKYELVKAWRDSTGAQLQSKFMGLPKSIQLFIDYYTCLPDNAGNPVYYYDAYHMDPLLAKAMGKYIK
jgi:murein L,D-transpeptidase YcbB/YkuD